MSPDTENLLRTEYFDQFAQGCAEQVRGLTWAGHERAQFYSKQNAARGPRDTGVGKLSLNKLLGSPGAVLRGTLPGSRLHSEDIRDSQDLPNIIRYRCNLEAESIPMLNRTNPVYFRKK
ncbi:hypothetical protein PCH_Pc22g17160 [Penicillium rubens Wisconsin 54-1255]|uniref:Uncharacterized protein n=1 Tax=Penicillium rubens (strain ATCC 28089 / DSM 1075 / NRRL 1951 / Wisconsin 54-1255) TaxID=500485 RepID=B6HSE0_PENRW|nr:hypothetical protein PCH_Pc22g17160 [Penicillium rubens Wisconsin 54-1255]